VIFTAPRIFKVLKLDEAYKVSVKMAITRLARTEYRELRGRSWGSGSVESGSVCRQLVVAVLRLQPSQL